MFKQLILSQHSFFYFSQAHISLNGRSTNNNSNDETAESGNQAQSQDNVESANSSRANTEEGNQERESDNATQSQAERSQQDQSQSPFGMFCFTILLYNDSMKC